MFLTAALLLGLSPEGSIPGAGRSTIRFGQELALSDSRLTGLVAERKISFTCEDTWDPVPGSELHLFVEHSPTIDFNRSFLSVSLNGGVLGSARLDETNERRKEMILSIPKEMLQRENTLVLSAEQLPAQPSSEGLWSLVSATSYIVVAFQPKAAPLQLASLPRPLLDPGSYRPFRLGVLTPERASSLTLEATVRIVTGLIHAVAPRPVKVTSVRSLGTFPLLAVGTPQELPQLGEIIRGAYRVQELPGGRTIRGKNGVPLDPRTGLVGLEIGPVLYVTGGTPGGVQRGAELLFSGRAGGSFALVAEEPPREPPRPREWKGWAPSKGRFTFSELGYGDLNLSKDEPVRLPIRFSPDTLFPREAGWIGLELASRTGPDPSATLRIAWNGRLLANIPGSRLKTSFQRFDEKIPGELLHPENLLILTFEGKSGASLGSASDIAVKRTYAAKLPELAYLRSAFYPFSLISDLSDVIVVLPEGPPDETLEILWKLSGILGRFAPGPRFDFRVRFRKELRPEERVLAHLIVLEAGGPPFLDAPSLDWGKLTKGAAELPVLQELRSPWNARRFVLRLRAPSFEALSRGLDRLADPAVLTHLTGDTALLGPELPSCYRMRPPVLMADQQPLSGRLEDWLQSHWLAVPGIVAATSLSLFLLLRQVLAARGLTSRHRRE